MRGFGEKSAVCEVRFVFGGVTTANAGGRVISVTARLLFGAPSALVPFSEMGSCGATGEGELTTSNWGTIPGESKVVLGESLARPESAALPSVGNFVASLAVFSLAWNSAANGEDCCGPGDSKEVSPGTGTFACDTFEMDTACI